MGGPRNYPCPRSLGSEGVELDDSKTGRAFPFENGWTEEVTKVVGSDENKEQSHREPGQEVNKVVAMGLHEGTNEPDVCC